MGRPTATERARGLAVLGGALAAVLAAAAIVAGCGSSSQDGGDLGACQDRTHGMPMVTWGIPGPDPSGVVILLHGGGFQPNPAGYRAEIQNGRAIEAGGVATVAIGYGRGATALPQIEDVYSRAQRCFPDAPICAVGDSAGGNLALMLATREPDLSCVIARAAPTDLTSLAAQGDGEGHRIAVAAFGERGLARFSPVRRARAIRARVLMIMAENDPLVPVAQGRELKKALPGAELLVLPPGPVAFVHGLGVTQSSVQAAIQREVAFLQQAMAAS